MRQPSTGEKLLQLDPNWTGQINRTKERMVKINVRKASRHINVDMHNHVNHHEKVKVALVYKTRKDILE